MVQLFHHSGFEPFADDPDQASVGNALLQHLDQPAVADVIEEPPDVGVDGELEARLSFLKRTSKSSHTCPRARLRLWVEG
jgi:hypothetical protein